MPDSLLLNADAIAGSDIAACGRQAETLGLDTIWVPEIFGREPFVTAAALLAVTKSIRVGTAIANVYVRDPMAAKADGRMARRAVHIYTDLPNYQRAWKAQDFAESDYVDGPSDALLDALVAYGSMDRVQAKLEERRAAGATGMIFIPLNLEEKRMPDWKILQAILDG